MPEVKISYEYSVKPSPSGPDVTAYATSATGGLRGYLEVSWKEGIDILAVLSKEDGRIFWTEDGGSHARFNAIPYCAWRASWRTLRSAVKKATPYENGFPPERCRILSVYVPARLLTRPDSEELKVPLENPSPIS